MPPKPHERLQNTVPVAAAAPLSGLLLSGGFSQRMGFDKTWLDYSGQPEIIRWRNIFAELQIPLVWSIRPEQYDPEFGPKIERIEDLSPGEGPLGALLSAHRHDSQRAWLVLACDWPLLGHHDVVTLRSKRQTQAPATAFQLPTHIEPLFTIYEPSFCRLAIAAFAQGQRSLQHMLRQCQPSLIGVEDVGLFLNANDARAQNEALKRLEWQTSAKNNQSSDLTGFSNPSSSK